MIEKLYFTIVMCYNTKLSRRQEELRKWAEVLQLDLEIDWEPQLQINGFSKPMTPIIANDNVRKVSMAQWGFIEKWNGKEKVILNARSETVDEKFLFKKHVQNKCMILVDGFYEWKWLDSKGKRKEKYLMESPNADIFMLEGIYRDNVDEETGEILRQYCILTTEAQHIMREIHNHKMRMPVSYFSSHKWQEVLKGNPKDFDVDFVATAI